MMRGPNDDWLLSNRWLWVINVGAFTLIALAVAGVLR